MREIVEKIQHLGFFEYGVCEYKNTRYLLVFMGYEYYREMEPKNFRVSPYYFASNKCYFAAKELCSYIESLGYSATVENKIIYDDILEFCGAVRGDNNLFFIKKCGSMFCVHLISTSAPLEIKEVGTRKCTHCGKCKSVCPMGALRDEGIVEERCLRNRMDIIGDVEARDKITQLLGCDECQRVCPINDTKEREDTFNAFSKEKIISGDMGQVSELVGKNMARKSRLQFQAMSIAANTKDTDLVDAIEDCKPIESLVELQKWCTGILKKLLT